MGTPSKIDILLRAREITGTRQFRYGLPSISAEEHELKESGTFNEARRQIMGQNRETRNQQVRYVRDMADEIGLSIVTKADYRKFLKWQLKPNLQVTKMFVPSLPKQKVKKTPKKTRNPMKSKPKSKPKKRHVQRNGNTMKSLRAITGVKVFSFPDSVWKVKKPRRRKK